MLKKIALACCIVALAMAVALPASAKVTIKLANSGPDSPDNRTVKAVAIFKHLVETGTNGEVEVKPFHASKLGHEREALEGIRMGTIEMGTLSGGPVAGFFPPVMFYDIPYLFSSAPAAWEFFKGETAARFNKAFQDKTGVRILATTENGFRHFTNNARPVHTPGDMAGLKVRTMQNPAHMAMVKAMGADPTPIPFSELYMALQQGVVDGMECPVVLIHDMKFYEVQKEMVMDGHLYNPLFIFINENFFQKQLTEEQRKVVMDAAQVLALTHNGFSQQANRDGIAKLKAKGMNIYFPTAEELGEFRSVAQPAGLGFVREKIGDQWVDATLAGVVKAEAAVGDRAEAVIDETIAESERLYAEIK